MVTKKFIRIGYLILLIVLVLASSLLVMPVLPIPNNYQTQIVLSGSMEPAIKKGALIFVKPLDAYRVNDIIVFGADNGSQVPTTHRLVSDEVRGGSYYYTTKGDANDSRDSRLVKESEVIGKVQFFIPYLGYFLNYVKKVLPDGGLTSVMGLFSYTFSYYNDLESSEGNIFRAGSLDLVLSSSEYSALIGPEVGGEKVVSIIPSSTNESLDMQYLLSLIFSSPSDQFCQILTVAVTQDGSARYEGLLSQLVVSTTTDFGAWEFNFTLPTTASIAHGASCSASMRFQAWRAEVAASEDSGYDDEELVALSFTARMVVLNKIFANPDTGAAPADREYLELYNNGNQAVDVLAWQISELAGAVETFHPIVASGATTSELEPFGGASTIISPGGSLILEFGGVSSKLNNAGDTIRLYDAEGTLLDSHTYPATAPDEIHTRSPDGIGLWTK